MSAWEWSVSGWLIWCDSIASAQWFAAITTRYPAATRPLDDPPAPQNRSVAVSPFQGTSGWRYPTCALIGVLRTRC